MIVDTDILSDFLSGEETAVQLVERYRQTHRVATTDITAFELYYGAYKSEQTDNNLAKTKGLLNTVPVISTSEDSMEVAGRLAAEQDAAGERIGVKDVLIGAIAAVENEPVLTGNVDEFRRMDDVDVLSPDV